MLTTADADQVKKFLKDLQHWGKAALFFQDNPWADDYLHASRLNWFLFLQSRFNFNPDTHRSDWLDIKADNFTEQILYRLDQEKTRLQGLLVDPSLIALRLDDLPPTLPPNLLKLVDDYLTAKDKKACGQQIEKLLFQHWELARNFYLTNNILFPGLQRAQESSTQALINYLLAASDRPELKNLSQSPKTISNFLSEELALGIKNASHDQKTFPLLLSNNRQLNEETLYLFAATLQKALQETNPSLTPDQAETITAQVGNKLSQQEYSLLQLRALFQEQARFQLLLQFQQERNQLLQKAITDTISDFNYTLSPEEIEMTYWAGLAQFIFQTLSQTPQLQERLRLPSQITDKEGHLSPLLDVLATFILQDVLLHTSNLRDLRFLTLPDNQLDLHIRQELKNAFAFFLLSHQRKFFSFFKNLYSFFSGSKTAPLALFKKEIFPNIDHLPDSLLASIKVAILYNLSVSPYSQETENNH